eukprot:17775-Heterococcus_DN1.PRE.3
MSVSPLLCAYTTMCTLSHGDTVFNNVAALTCVQHTARWAELIVFNSSNEAAAAINFSVVDTISVPEQQQFAPTLMQRSDYRFAALLVNGPQRLANVIEVPKNDPYYSIMFSNLANAELETTMKLKALRLAKQIAAVLASVAVVPIVFRFTYSLDDSPASKCTPQLPQCRVQGVDTIYTIDIVKYTGELIVSGDMSTDTRCFYDRLLDIPYSGLSNNYTSDRKGVVGRVGQ